MGAVTIYIQCFLLARFGADIHPSHDPNFLEIFPKLTLIFPILRALAPAPMFWGKKPYIKGISIRAQR